MLVSKLEKVKGLRIEEALEILNDANKNGTYTIHSVRNDSFVTADMQMFRVRVYYDPQSKIVTEAVVG